MSRVEQREQALRLANEVRFARSRIKKELAATPYPESLALASQYLRQPPAVLGTMAIEKLLVACRGVGRHRTRKALLRAQIAPTLPIGRMTSAQKLALIRVLAEYAKGNGSHP